MVNPLNPNQAPRVQRPNSQDQSIRTDFFVYNALFNTITQGTTQTTNIQIQADSDFEIQKLTAFASHDAATEPSQDSMQYLNVLITDTGTGRQLSDIAVPVRSLFGSAELPFILPNTKILQSRATLSIQVSNISSNFDYDILQLSFIGRKIFRGFQ